MLASFLVPCLHLRLYADPTCVPGALLPFAADPPPESGLYHHGEEPGRAGYTVDDMFRLARSAVQQQRVLGLQTVTNLIIKVGLLRTEKQTHVELSPGRWYRRGCTTLGVFYGCHMSLVESCLSVALL